MTTTDEKNQLACKILTSIQAEVSALHDDLDGIKTRLMWLDTADDPSTGGKDSFGIKTRLTSIDTRLALVHKDLARLSHRLMTR